MRVVGALVAFGLILSLSGCMAVDWSPTDPSKEYKPSKRAVRVSSESDVPGCGEKLGVMHASGDKHEVIEAFGNRAADVGGTHWVLRGDEAESELVTRHGRYISRTSVETEHRMWAVVYRDCR